LRTTHVGRWPVVATHVVDRRATHRTRLRRDPRGSIAARHIEPIASRPTWAGAGAGGDRAAVARRAGAARRGRRRPARGVSRVHTWRDLTLLDRRATRRTGGSGDRRAPHRTGCVTTHVGRRRGTSNRLRRGPTRSIARRIEPVAYDPRGSIAGCRDPRGSSAGRHIEPDCVATQVGRSPRDTSNRLRRDPRGLLDRRVPHRTGCVTTHVGCSIAARHIEPVASRPTLVDRRGTHRTRCATTHLGRSPPDRSNPRPDPRGPIVARQRSPRPGRDRDHRSLRPRGTA